MATIVGLAIMVMDRSGDKGVEILLATPTTEIRVYVSGAVASPGVYTLKAGDRAVDAIEKAGGATPEADLDQINLAARLVDGGRLHIPKVGETGSPSGPSQKININTASLALLDTLPGIGEVRARNIIDYRTKNGPFQSIEDLKELKLIPSSTFEQVKDLITVR